MEILPLPTTSNAPRSVTGWCKAFFVFQDLAGQDRVVNAASSAPLGLKVVNPLVQNSPRIIAPLARLAAMNGSLGQILPRNLFSSLNDLG